MNKINPSWDSLGGGGACQVGPGLNKRLLDGSPRDVKIQTQHWRQQRKPSWRFPRAALGAGEGGGAAEGTEGGGPRIADPVVAEVAPDPPPGRK